MKRHCFIDYGAGRDLMRVFPLSKVFTLCKHFRLHFRLASQVGGFVILQRHGDIVRLESLRAILDNDTYLHVPERKTGDLHHAQLDSR